MREDRLPPRLWHMGRELHSRVRTFFESPPGPESTPLELLLATLDHLETKVQPAGRGSRVFPYNRVVVHILQPHADRAAVESVFRQLDGRLRERLAELRCEASDPITTELAFETVAAVDGAPALEIECFRDVEAFVERPLDATYPTLRITVVKGACSQVDYTFSEAAVAIGRTPEPVDALGRVRRNHVAFLSTRDGVTETVARAHARLQFDAASRAYHLFNEASSNPTFVLRAGRSIHVPPRNPRGLRLQSGDEIQLGRAVIRLAIG
jgi:FHA domain